MSHIVPACTNSMPPHEVSRAPTVNTLGVAGHELENSIVATAVVGSPGVMGEAPKRVSNPLELRAKNHTLSLLFE